MLVRAAGTALVDVTLELGGVNETVTVSAEARNNITLDSQAIAAASTSSSSTICRATAATSSPSCC